MGVELRDQTHRRGGVIAGAERIRVATVIWSAGVRATLVGQWLGV
jgi:NADH dehydrogenase FAD-containing subunit